MEIMQLWNGCSLVTGPLIWDCWRAQELEQPEDGEQKTAPEFLYSSLLGVRQVEGVFAEVDGICS